MKRQKAEGRRQKGGPALRLGLVFAGFWLWVSGFWFPLAAKNGAYKSTAHGDPVKGPQRLTDRPRGSCSQCHEQHASHDATTPQRNADALFTANDNNLCFTCHGMPSDSGGFPGNSTWMQSSHALSPRMLRTSVAALTPSDAGKCINCHDPHGVKDSAGVIPAMLAAREQDICLECHDGSRGADIRNELRKSYFHGMNARGKHDPHEGSDASRYASLPATNRHVSCSDCHNVHRATKDLAPPSAPEASSLLAGVSRIEVANGPAGTAPRYTWRGPDDPGIANEYEICFKCHSSWTRLAPSQSDIALITNPANPSFHPLQGRGRNTNIDPRAFVNGFAGDSILSCSDCHTSDDQNVRGPHGSSYRYLLKLPATTLSTTQAMPKNDLCFACHSWDVYANAASTQDVLRASRFNAVTGAGHAFHTGSQQIPCYACHETHGSTRYSALIARGRLPGITSYLQTPTGGTCASTCHSPKTYTLSYPR